MERASDSWRADWRVAVVVFAFVVFAFGACTDAGADRGHPKTLDEFDQEIMDLICGEGARCCAMNGGSFSESDCRVYIHAVYAYNAQNDLNLFAPGQGTFNPEAAADCLAGVRAQMANCFIRAPNLNSCDVFFTAQQAAGQDCHFSIECAQPQGELVTCPTTQCVAHRVVGIGQSCSSGEVCFPSDLAVCRPDFMTCGPRETAGAACKDARDCGGEVECCVAGVCGSRVGEGQPCGGQCLSGSPNCAQGLVCVGSVCVQALRIGEVCTDSKQCEDGADCQGSSAIPGASTCQPSFTLACKY